MGFAGRCAVTAGNIRSTTTSIVAQSASNTSSTRLAVTNEAAAYPVEVFSPESLSTPRGVSHALELVQKHAVAATLAARSLPVLGGVYWPSLHLVGGTNTAVPHGLGVAVSWHVGTLRFANANAAAYNAQVYELGQSTDNNVLYLAPGANCIVDLWVYPKPSVEGSTPINVVLNQPAPIVAQTPSSPTTLTVTSLTPGTRGQFLVSGIPGGQTSVRAEWLTLSGDVDTTGGADGQIFVTGILRKTLPALPGSDQYLHYTGSAWAFAALPTSLPPNGSAGGDLSGTYPNPSVAGLKSKALPTLPASDQYLHYTGSAWSFTALPTSLPPNGSAGGDLSGSYPNPSCIGLHGSTKLSLGAIGSASVPNTNPVGYIVVNINGGGPYQIPYFNVGAT